MKLNEMKRWRAGGPSFLAELRSLGEDAVRAAQEESVALAAKVTSGKLSSHEASRPATDECGDVPAPNRVLFCAQCNSFGLGLRKCSRCYSVAYCSPECQKKHWKAHKVSCSKTSTIGHLN